MDDPTSNPDEPSRPGSGRELVNPVPFVVAAVGFVIVAVAAIVFLREDDDTRLVHPDVFRRLDETTFEAVADDRSACDDLVRVQVDETDTLIFVELVVRAADDLCPEGRAPLRAEVTLPGPIDGRDLRAGAGRTQIPCAPQGSDFRCVPGR